MYPQVLKEVLEMIGRNDVWELCLAKNIPEKMHEASGRKNTEEPIYTIKYDTINATINSKISIKLNQRQLWFFSELQKGRKLKAEDIVEKWSVGIATSWRDIAELINHRAIHFIGTNKNGHYQINLSGG